MPGGHLTRRRVLGRGGLLAAGSFLAAGHARAIEDGMAVGYLGATAAPPGAAEFVVDDQGVARFQGAATGAAGDRAALFGDPAASVGVAIWGVLVSCGSWGGKTIRYVAPRDRADDWPGTLSWAQPGNVSIEVAVSRDRNACAEDAAVAGVWIEVGLRAPDGAVAYLVRTRTGPLMRCLGLEVRNWARLVLGAAPTTPRPPDWQLSGYVLAQPIPYEVSP